MQPLRWSRENKHQNPWGLKGPSWGPDKAPGTTTFLECVLTCELEQLGHTAGCSGRRAAAEALCWLLLLSPAPAAIGLLPWALATGPSLSCSSGLMCVLLTIPAGARRLQVDSHQRSQAFSKALGASPRGLGGESGPCLPSNSWTLAPQKVRHPNATPEAPWPASHMMLREETLSTCVCSAPGQETSSREPGQGGARGQGSGGCLQTRPRTLPAPHRPCACSAGVAWCTTGLNVE
ncbi:uncharacterized protein LOC116741269 [Phocoena sinus]|uniref:uncharacterized protein LOC116741269 n=1 Tax=Phocoena sinus TaxID=42100 RepID=UPI0013C51516|nr:uncharacterized protein LOC116741269 [Phocoena sinus]